MTSNTSIDGVLVQWGERLFYPSNRMVRAATPRLGGAALRARASAVRLRIEATVVRRAPQVMVKVTGGGRGMAAVAAHLRYISKNGRLPFEDDRGVTREGQDALHDLVEQWRYGGSEIGQTSARREAFNIMLSMPAGTDAQAVQRAARAFGIAELANHRYVMVLHTHQANPHVHLSVRAEGRDGKRLNPRKEDLHRWRETFADKLRELGIEAEASSQATRGANRRSERVWERQPSARSRPAPRSGQKSGPAYRETRLHSLEAWAAIAKALGASIDPEDRKLSTSIMHYVAQMPAVRGLRRDVAPHGQQALQRMDKDSMRGVGMEPGQIKDAPEILR